MIKNFILVVICEYFIYFSKLVGFMTWNNNGNRGIGICFVFNDGYIFICRYVVYFMVGEGIDLSLWLDIISKCVKVIFIYKTFYFIDSNWYFFELWFVVFDVILDYVILKLRENGIGFFLGLFG